MVRSVSKRGRNTLLELNRDERMLLLRFVCSFAWVDLEVRATERAFVSQLARRLDLDEEQRRQVEAWLAKPPSPESVDPALVPRKHRMRFIRAIESVIAVDGEISPLERKQLLLFAQMLRSPD
jgi:uncharacterized tellurite resistance protein B-like protein